MIQLNKLLGPVLILSTGFVFGLGAANYLAASSDGRINQAVIDDTYSHSSSEVLVNNVVPDKISVPADLGVKSSSVKEDKASDSMREDISLLQTVDITRQEVNSTETSPEELLVSTVRVDRVLNVSADEIREVEKKLRLESDTAASTPRGDNSGLLGHEIL